MTQELGKQAVKSVSKNRVKDSLCAYENDLIEGKKKKKTVKEKKSF